MESRLNYKEWIKDQDLTKKDWILVAQQGSPSVNELLFTHSVLVDTQHLISKNSNDLDKMTRLIHIPEEDTYFIKKVNSVEVQSIILSNYYIPNGVIDVNNIRGNQRSDYELNDFCDYQIINSLIVRPFVFLFTNDRIGERIELDIKFPLFYDAQRVENEYIRIDDNGDKITIAKIEKEGKSIRLLVSSTYLSDYLTLSGYALWRYHSHLLHTITENKDEPDFEYQTEYSRYKVFVGEGSKDYKNWNIVLRGHELLLPYEKDNYEPILIRRFNKYESFIVGLDVNGNEIVMNSKVKQPEFFTPVYFKNELLKHFYDNPKKYSVLPTFISGGDGFAIDYGIVDDYIQVYLGDLPRLPPEEQKLWKSYNVGLKEKKIPEDRIKRDFLNEFAGPNDIVDQLKSLKNATNALFRKKYTISLFKDLNQPDSYREKIIHIPITDEWNEFNSIIEAMDIVLNESLNIKLKKLINGQIEDSVLQELGTIETFRYFIISTGLAENIAAKIIKPFRLTHQLRNKFASHRTSSDYIKILKELGINGKKKKAEIIESIIKQFISQLAIFSRLVLM